MAHCPCIPDQAAEVEAEPEAAAVEQAEQAEMEVSVNKKSKKQKKAPDPCDMCRHDLTTKSRSAVKPILLSCSQI